MVMDLRAVNRVIEPMGPLQPGIPFPPLSPRSWPRITINLKGCFFPAPLHEEDSERFAFSVPALISSVPIKR